MQPQKPPTVFDTKAPQKTLKVLEAFTLEYKVQFPLTLILSHKSIIKYQLIFRQLLYCRYVERNLEKLWLQHQATKECSEALKL